MHHNWNQGDISVPMDTSSYTVTTSRHVPIVEKITSKNTQKLTKREALYQMWCGKQVKYMSGKR